MSGPAVLPTASKARGAPRPRAPTDGSIRCLFADWAPALPLIACAFFLLIAPALTLVHQSLTTSDGTWTVVNWTQTLGSAFARRAIFNTLTLAATVATLVTLIGAPLSWRISRLSSGGRALHIGVLNVATNLSNVSLGFAYVAALGSYGMVTLAAAALGLPLTPPPQGSFWGLVLAYVYSNLPLFVLLSLPAMTLLKDEWWEAAQTSAATRLQFWRHIGLPVLGPFLFADWLLIFTWSIGMYGLPVALVGSSPTGYRLITVEMSKTLLGSLFGGRTMPVYAVILMLLAILSLLIYRLIVKRGTQWLR